eukprot:9428703-Heterocapsa_arctica.AAC.1
MPGHTSHTTRTVDGQRRSRRGHRFRRVSGREKLRPTTPGLRAGQHAGSAVDHEEQTSPRAERVDAEDLGYR